MIAGYMWLGAWLLTIIVAGVFVTLTGLPDDGTGNDDYEEG